MTKAPFPLLAKATTDCWMKQIWKFMHQHNLALYDLLPKLDPQCLHNMCLMSWVIQKFDDPSHLHKINNCHQYLRVTYLSNITMANGFNVIPQAFWLQQTFHAPMSSHYTWPRASPHLQQEHVTLWQQLLMPLFKLRVTLGKWLVNPIPYWQWSYNPTAKAPLPMNRSGIQQLDNIMHTPHLPPTQDL